MSRITRFAPNASGGQIHQFEIDGIIVQIQPRSADENARAKRLAEVISAGIEKIPPMRPVRLLGVGCVRFLDGRPWLLNKREGGFASFGVPCESWDDLFRRYDVRVTDHGSDATGEWWSVENIPAVSQ